MGGEKIAKDFGKANEIVEEMGLSLKRSKGIDEMTKKLKLKKGIIDSNSSALENMLTIAEMGPKKFAAMADALAGDVAGAALKEIVGEEFLVKAKLGDVSKKEWDLRIAKLREQLGDLGDLAVDRKKIEESDARHKNTTSAQIDNAMNKIRNAFTKPEMIEAIEKLAKHLPAMADGVAELIEFIVGNPALSAGLAVGARVGLPAAGAMGKNLLFGAAGGPAVAEGGRGLAGAAIRRLGPHARTAGTALATYSKNLTTWSTGPMAMHTNALKAAAGMGAAAAAGWALGTVIREEIIEPMLKEAELKRRAAHQISKEAGAAGDLSIAQRKAALEEIRKKKADVKEITIEEGTGMAGFERGLSQLSELLGIAEGPEKTRQAQLDILNKQEDRHQKALEKALTAQEVANEGLEVFGKAAKKVAGEVGGPAAGGTTTRGPVTKAKPKPGAAPEPG
jgi:hypothetical protein